VGIIYSYDSLVVDDLVDLLRELVLYVSVVCADLGVESIFNVSLCKNYGELVCLCLAVVLLGENTREKLRDKSVYCTLVSCLLSIGISLFKILKLVVKTI
jgi:hypothetical protein